MPSPPRARLEAKAPFWAKPTPARTTRREALGTVQTAGKGACLVEIEKILETKEVSNVRINLTILTIRN